MTVTNYFNASALGATVTARLANDIKNELPEIKGFSERNLLFMVQCYKEYDAENLIVKQPVSQLQEDGSDKIEFRKQAVSQIPWGHNLLHQQKIMKKETRLWYIEQTILNGWSRDILSLMIKSNLHLPPVQACRLDT